MGALIIDKYGRVVIPKATRARQGWGPGTALVLSEDAGTVRLERAAQAQQGRGLTVSDGHLVFDAEWLGTPDGDPVREAIEGGRAERSARIAP